MRMRSLTEYTLCAGLLALLALLMGAISLGEHARVAQHDRQLAAQAALTDPSLGGDTPADTAAPVPAVPQPPRAPEDLESTLVRYGNGVVAIALTWDDRSQAESHFMLRRADAEGMTVLQHVPADSVTFLDSGVLMGNTYTYELSACGEGGCSAPVPVAALAIPLGTETPTNSVATRIVTWEFVDGAFTTRVVQDESGGVDAEVAAAKARCATIPRAEATWSPHHDDPTHRLDFGIPRCELRTGPGGADRGLGRQR